MQALATFARMCPALRAAHVRACGPLVRRIRRCGTRLVHARGKFVATPCRFLRLPSCLRRGAVGKILERQQRVYSIHQSARIHYAGAMVRQLKAASVNDKMQHGYRYELTAPTGRNFDPEFSPELSPKEMLALGVFSGRYMTDCRAEFPTGWFEHARLSSSIKRRVVQIKRHCEPGDLLCRPRQRSGRVRTRPPRA